MFPTTTLDPGRLTWNLQITHLERKMIFQTSMIMCKMLIFWGVDLPLERAAATLAQPQPLTVISCSLASLTRHGRSSSAETAERHRSRLEKGSLCCHWLKIGASGKEPWETTGLR